MNPGSPLLPASNALQTSADFKKIQGISSKRTLKRRSGRAKKVHSMVSNSNGYCDNKTSSKTRLIKPKQDVAHCHRSEFCCLAALKSERICQLRSSSVQQRWRDEVLSSPQRAKESTVRVDSLKNVTLAIWASDTLPHIRGNFHMLENQPKFLLDGFLKYKWIERLVNSFQVVSGVVINLI